MIDAGRMDRQITFQSFTTSASGIGELEKTWANIGTNPTVFAEVRTLSTKEMADAGQTLSILDRVFITRWRSDIVAKMRIVYDGKNYDIYGYPTEIGRQEGLRIIGKAVN